MNIIYVHAVPYMQSVSDLLLLYGEFHIVKYVLFLFTTFQHSAM